MSEFKLLCEVYADGVDRVYRLDREVTVDDDGLDLEKPTRYVYVSDCGPNYETMVYPLYIREGFGESDVVGSVKDSYVIGEDAIAGGSYKYDDETYLEDLLESNE